MRSLRLLTRLLTRLVLALFASSTTWVAGAPVAPSIPPALADYGVLGSDGRTLRPAGRTLVYHLASPLFSDYALKFRTLTLPAGAQIDLTVAVANPDRVLDLPTGTIISKTFYYARDPERTDGWVNGGNDQPGESLDLARYRLIETRILRRLEDGNWQANTYVWDETQTRASLRRIGLEVPGRLREPATNRVKEFTYGVPNARQCQTCHAIDATAGQAGIQPIGLTPRALNTRYPYLDGSWNPLRRLSDLATVVGLDSALAALPTPVAYSDTKAPLDERARAYLHVNCTHCHNALGDARQSGVFFDREASGAKLGLCKQHVAAGSGSGDLSLDIVPGRPERSLLIARMEATSGQAMMPRLGRSLVDDEGVALLKQWIAGMPGVCAPSR